MNELFHPAWGGSAIPPVEVMDIKRVWSLLHSLPNTDGSLTSSSGISQSLFAQECSPGANVMAVFLRATLITILLQQGLLEGLHKGNELNEPVYTVAAKFPLPNGINGIDFADLTAFVAAVHSETRPTDAPPETGTTSPPQ